MRGVNTHGLKYVPCGVRMSRIGVSVCSYALRSLAKASTLVPGVSCVELLLLDFSCAHMMLFLLIFLSSSTVCVSSLESRVHGGVLATKV